MSPVRLVAPVRPPVPARWTAWLIWRQQRASLAALAIVTGVLSVLLAVAALKAGQAGIRGLPACLASGTRDCRPGLSLLNQAFSQLRNLRVALLVAPAVIGAFVGAPVIAREHESGVFRYSSTQGLPPERWLAGTLLLGGSVVAALMTVAGVLFNWASGLSDLGFGFTLTNADFAAQFPALPAWSLFAYILGFACGAVIRRSVPAMGATLLGVGGTVYLTQDFLRPHYASLVFWTPHTGRTVNLFWPDQAIEAAWLVLAALILATALVISPPLLRAAAWRRAASRLPRARCPPTPAAHRRRRKTAA